MCSTSRSKPSFFSKTNSLHTTSKQQMKSLVLHLMEESPKAKLRYGTLREILRKPLSVHFTQALPECTCTSKKTCSACSRLALRRGQMEGASTKSDSKNDFARLPSVPSMELEDLGLLDTSELSASKESEEFSESESSVAEVLQSLFQDADHDAKRAAKESVRQYRSKLISEQAERFNKITQGLLSQSATVTSDYTERQRKLEMELKSAEKNIDVCPTSPIAALISEMEQHRIGREGEFQNQMKSMRSASQRSSEIEKSRAEIFLALAKLQNAINNCTQLTVPFTARLTESKRLVEQKVAQLSTLNVETLQPDAVSQIVGEADKFAEACYSALEECESAAKPAAPLIQQPSIPQPQLQSQIVTTTVQQASAGRLAIAQEAKQYVENWRAQLKPFMEDPNFKAQRQELQRAVFSSVNMLSSESESSAPIPVKLNLLLDGNTVEITGRTVSAKCHELGVDFVKLAICKKLIGQAEEEVSSQPSVAIPLASAALPLVATRPDMAKLLLSFFYITCPLLVPVVAIVPDVNPDAQLEQLGYKKRPDGSFEGLERFLKRMSGIATLFGTMAVLPLAQPKPITVGTVWTTLSYLLKMPPFPDLTPTIMFELLKNCSKQLYATYGRQFDKMARTIKTVFLPKLEADSGSVSTLKQFLNTEVAAICNWPLSQHT